MLCIFTFVTPIGSVYMSIDGRLINSARPSLKGPISWVKMMYFPPSAASSSARRASPSSKPYTLKTDCIHRMQVSFTWGKATVNSCVQKTWHAHENRFSLQSITTSSSYNLSTTSTMMISEPWRKGSGVMQTSHFRLSILKSLSVLPLNIASSEFLLIKQCYFN